MLVVNLFGGPSSGKSSMAASIFATLKWKGLYDVELIPEAIKLLAWERPEQRPVLSDEMEAFSHHLRYLRALDGKVSVAITDCPLLMFGAYNKTLEPTARKIHLEFNNLNVFLKRVKPFRQGGRWQSEEESLAIDDIIREMLWSLPGKPFVEVDGSPAYIISIIGYIDKALEETNND